MAEASARFGDSGRLQRLETGRLGERAREVLRESIRNGHFSDGLLPSEERLAEQLGVSRTTIREALRSLEEDGLITRQRGIGTRVNEHVLRTISLNRVVGFFDLIQDAGYEARIAWTTIARGSAVPEVAKRLGRPEGSELVQVERLFLADGQPVLHLTENVPVDEVAGPFGKDDVPDSIFAFAETLCRTAIDHTVVEIVPTVAGSDVPNDLQLEVGQPLLRLIETHYAVDGNPMIVSVIHTDDRVLRFTVVRKRMDGR